MHELFLLPLSFPHSSFHYFGANHIKSLEIEADTKRNQVDPLGTQEDVHMEFPSGWLVIQLPTRGDFRSVSGKGQRSPNVR